MAIVYIERGYHYKDLPEYQFIFAAKGEVFPDGDAEKVLLEFSHGLKFHSDPNLRKAVIRAIRHIPTQSMKLL